MTQVGGLVHALHDHSILPTPADNPSHIDGLTAPSSRLMSPNLTPSNLQSVQPDPSDVIGCVLEAWHRRTEFRSPVGQKSKASPTELPSLKKLLGFQGTFEQPNSHDNRRMSPGDVSKLSFQSYLYELRTNFIQEGSKG